jgi:hypothetical protein
MSGVNQPQVATEHSAFDQSGSLVLMLWSQDRLRAGGPGPFILGDRYGPPLTAYLVSILECELETDRGDGAPPHPETK